MVNTIEKVIYYVTYILQSDIRTWFLYGVETNLKNGNACIVSVVIYWKCSFIA